MAKILTSLHGKLLGLDSLGRLIAPKGVVAGDHGSQVASPSPSTVSWFEDFLGDVIPDQINVVEGTDSATSDFAVLASGLGGVGRFTTGDAGTGAAADFPQITQYLNWKAANGNLCFEARFKLSRITNAYAFLGFTDVITLEAPIVSAASADTITTNASDAVGFLFDTRQTTDVWHLVGVAADVDATRQATSYAPVADTYETFRIELSATGVATFYRNGVQVGTSMSGAVTAATLLTPTVMVGNTSGTSSFTADLDYIHTSMARV
jgi:hypothetical protein